MSAFDSLIAGAPGVGMGGVGAANFETMEALRKALTAGAGIDPAGFTSGRAMIPESLDATLVNQLWTEEEAKLFRKLKTAPIKSIVHQWAERTDVGGLEGAFVAEGGDSTKHDQVLGRQSTEAKFIQTHREATLQALESNTLEEALALEANAGALWCIRAVENFMFSGDSDHYPLQFNGLRKQMTEVGGDNVIDVRAKASTQTFEQSLEDSQEQIRSNYGRGDCFFSDVGVISAFQRVIRDRIRFPARDQDMGARAVGGATFNVYPTIHGDLDLVEDLFISADGLNPGPGTTPRASTLAGAPGTGAITASTVSVLSSIPTGETAQWQADDAGDYFYTLVASNNLGDGPEEAGSAAATIPADPSSSIARIVCTVPTGAGRPTAIKIYRSRKDGTASTQHRYVKTVGVPAGTASSVTIYDGNNDLPGTSTGWVLTTGAGHNAIEWHQFLPMIKFPLYPSSAAVWPFLVLLYGSLPLRKPKRHVMIKNIIPEKSDWFD